MQKSDTITLLSISNYYSESSFSKVKISIKFSSFFGCHLGNIFKISLHLPGAWRAENTNICFKDDAY